MFSNSLRALLILSFFALQPPSARAEDTATAGEAAGFVGCVGDCDGDNVVVISELITLVNIALGLPGSDCPANAAGVVTIDVLVTAVVNALEGCGLGRRHFSLNPESSLAIFVTASAPEPIVVPGFTGFLDLYAGPVDPVSGVAQIDITGASEFISVAVPDNFVQCLRPIPTQFPVINAGTLFCNGGFTIGLCNERNHNIGVVDTCTAPTGPGAGLPEGTPCTSNPECASGQCFSEADCLATSCVFPLERPRVEGPDERHPGVCIGPFCEVIPIIPIVEVGGGGPVATDEIFCPREPDAGDGSLIIVEALLEFSQFRTLGLWAEITLEEELPCGDEPAIFAGIFEFPFTTSTSAATVFNANNEPGVTLQDSVTGENFSCDDWTTEDGPGTLVLAQLAVGFQFLPEDSVVSWVFDD